MPIKRSDMDDSGPSSSSGQRRGARQSSQSQPHDLADETTTDRLVNNCVRYMLVADQKKLPIKRQDIVKHVLEDQSKMFNVVMEDAKKKLEMVFGFRLIEMSKKGVYILVSKMENKEQFFSSWNQSQLAKRGLLFVVLATIFMNGNTIQEDQLWRMLKKFGIAPDVPHDLLGDVKKVLTKEFVQQKYIEYNVIPGREPPTHEFLCGERANVELSKLQVLEFVSQVYGGGRKPEDWLSQFKEASSQD